MIARRHSQAEGNPEMAPKLAIEGGKEGVMKYSITGHLLHSSFLDPNQFPRILTIAYEQEQKMLQNEVHLVKKL